MKGFTAPHTGTAGRPIAVARAALVARDRKARILLVTSSLGCGHLRAAEAIEAAIGAVTDAVEVRQLDFWSLMNPGVASIVQEKYLELVLEHPDLYARLHRLDERTWRRVIENDIPPPAEVIELIELVNGKSSNGVRSFASVFEKAVGPYASDLLLYPTACAAMPTHSGERAGNNVALLRLALLRWGFLRLLSRMEQRLLEFEPDVVVATQMVPAALVSACKQHISRWAGLPLVGVLTDFGAHDYWAQPGVDLYCVPHATIAGPPLTRCDGDSERLIVTGVPLMSEFEAPPDGAEARRCLGFDADERIVAVLGGGLGLGLEELVEPLLRDVTGCTFLVMAGRNEAALQRLRRLALKARSRLRVYGWTEHMAQYIAAADFVIGKPGGLTVAEVLACGRPLLVTRSLQGQESFNVRFLEQEAVGKFVPEDELTAVVARWLANPHELAAMQERAWRAGSRTGAAQVAGHALELAESSLEAQRAMPRGEVNAHR